MAGDSTAPAKAKEYLVAGVAHTRGLNGAFWITDLTALNRGDAAAEVTLSFHGATSPPPLRRTVGVRQQLAFDDVLATAFGVTGEDVGLIRVASSGPLDVQARTWAVATNSCAGASTHYGQTFPGVEPGSALRGTRVGYLSGLRSDGAFRTNLELVNPGSRSATAHVTFRDGEGARIGTPLSREVPPGRRVGVTAALPPGHRSAFAEVRTFPPTAAVIAFASVIDGASNDPATVPLVVGPYESLDGPWAGTVTLASVSNAYGTSRTGCAADVLRRRFGDVGAARVTFTGDRLIFDSLPPWFGHCSPGWIANYWGQGEWDLFCSLQLPFDAWCDDGSAMHFYLPEGLEDDLGFVVEQLSPDAIRFEFTELIYAQPGNTGYENGLWTTLRFDLARVP